MSAPASQTQWYLARDGQQYGPLSEPELAKFIELGHLQPTDLLWRDGFPDWRPAMVVFPPQRHAPRPAPGRGPRLRRYGRPASSRRAAGGAARAAERGPAQQRPDLEGSSRGPAARQARYAEPEEDESSLGAAA